MFMEYLKGGSLQDLLKSRSDPLTEAEAKTVMLQVLDAIAYCHKNKIVHRDIKPHNILLCEENDLTKIKLIDFGISGTA